jgi:diguanylate cyclase
MQTRHAKPVHDVPVQEAPRHAPARPDEHCAQPSTLELLRDAGLKLKALQQTLPPNGHGSNTLDRQITVIAGTIERAGLQSLDLELQVAQMRYQPYYDPLTRLPNRALLFDRLGQAMARAARRSGQLALLLLDLDEFKDVNDRFGHAVGDRLLLSVADRLRAATRNSDTTCRYGGDEFVILLPDLEGADHGADTVAHKIQSGFLDPFHIGDHSITMTVSIGSAVYPVDATTVRGLFHHADLAMYRSKHRPKWFARG